MNDLKEFNINVNGIVHKAIVVWTYELNQKIYCIYAVKDENKNYNLYNGEIINNTVVPVTEDLKEVTEKITKSLTSTIKR